MQDLPQKAMPADLLEPVVTKYNATAIWRADQRIGSVPGVDPQDDPFTARP